ncbi:MAG: histidine phosphatase family protein [Clostridia bacterium]
MKIFVLRHGQTDWNIESKLLGKTDLPINQEGRYQALAVLSKIKKLDYNLVICSPKKRTRQTCNTVNREKNSYVIYNEKIVERSFGALEGKYAKDIENLNMYWDYNLNLVEKNVEPIKDFLSRVYSFMDEMRQTYHDKNILIVTHGGVCRAIKCYVEGIPKDGDIASFTQGNCELYEYNL